MKHLLNLIYVIPGLVISYTFKNYIRNLFVSEVESSMDLTAIITVWKVHFDKINILSPIFDISRSGTPED